MLLCFLIAEHKVSLDVEQMNKEILDQDRNLWDALENSRWLPNEITEVY